MPRPVFQPIHRVVVEFIRARAPEVLELDSAEAALERAEAAKTLPDAWHIFYSVKKTRTGRHFIQLSVYFCRDTGQWERAPSEGTAIIPPKAPGVTPSRRALSLP